MRVPEYQRKSYVWRWTAALAGLAVLTFALVMGVVVPALRVQAAATVATYASATISADTAGVAPGSGVYTTLTGPAVQEGAVGDIATGTIVLDAPAAFEFQPTATVSVSVSPTTANATKIAAPGSCGGGSSSASATVAADKITIEVCAASSSTSVSKLTWSGIKVRPKTGPAAPVTNQAITYSGTGAINGIATGVDPLGLLTETNGAPATITLPALALSGAVNTVVGPWTANVQDQFGNPAVGASVSWSITSVPSGATCQQLIAPQTNTDTSGNATTSMKLGHLAGNYQLSVTSGTAGPTTDVATATGGPGSPCAPPTPPTSTPTSTPTPGTPTPTGTPPTSTPTRTSTPVPGAATATPTTGPMESVTLVGGTCNPVASTYPNGTPVTTIAGAVTPPSALISVWAFQAGTWLGYSPQFPQASQTFNVDRLGVAFICVSSAATWSRPLI